MRNGPRTSSRIFRHFVISRAARTETGGGQSQRYATGVSSYGRINVTPRPLAQRGAIRMEIARKDGGAVFRLPGVLEIPPLPQGET